jgi:hypothetical protein
MGDGAAAPFNGVHIMGNIRPAGGFDTLAESRWAVIAMGGPNLTVHLGLKINHTTINRRVPRRATNWPWNRKGGSVCGDIFLGNKRHWGGG